MAYTWDVTKPLGTDGAYVLDDEFRELKEAIEDFMADAHIFDKTDPTHVTAYLKPELTFAAGTKMVFCQAEAPTGWTQVTTLNDKMLRVVSDGSGGGTGGAWTHNHGGTTAGSGAHSHTFSGTTGGPSTYWNNMGTNTATAFAVTGIHTHTYSGTTSSVADHTHTVSSETAWRPSYVNVIVCTKD